MKHGPGAIDQVGLGPRPMIIFAAATGLRPAEWIALEKRDIKHEERAVYVRRSFTRRQLKLPKTEASLRAVPLQARALDAWSGYPRAATRHCSFPGSAAATWISTTSVPITGGGLSALSASIHFVGSTICGIPLRPLLSALASPLSTFLVTWARA